MMRFSILFLLGVLLMAPVRTEAADLVGRASIGASGGGMLFLSGDNFGNGSARPIGHVVIKYNFTEHLAGVVESGWGWNAFEPGGGAQDTLATVIPTTIGMEYRFQFSETDIWPHLGVGGGAYSMGIKDTFRTWARAGDKVEQLLWTSPGLYGKFGAEYLFPNGVSVNLDLLYHTIFSSNEDRYAFTPQPGDDTNQARQNLSNTWGVENTSFAEVRLGVNYYFTVKSSGPAPPEPE